MMDDQGEDTFFVPKDAVQGHECAPGDTLKFSVLGMDKDGDIEVMFSGYDKGRSDDYDQDLKRTFQKAPSDSMMG